MSKTQIIKTKTKKKRVFYSKDKKSKAKRVFYSKSKNIDNINKVTDDDNCVEVLPSLMQMKLTDSILINISPKSSISENSLTPLSVVGDGIDTPTLDFSNYLTITHTKGASISEENGMDLNDPFVELDLM